MMEQHLCRIFGNEPRAILGSLGITVMILGDFISLPFDRPVLEFLMLDPEFIGGCDVFCPSPESPFELSEGLLRK